MLAAEHSPAAPYYLSGPSPLPLSSSFSLLRYVGVRLLLSQYRGGQDLNPSDFSCAYTSRQHPGANSFEHKWGRENEDIKRKEKKKKKLSLEFANRF